MKKKKEAPVRGLFDGDFMQPEQTAAALLPPFDPLPPSPVSQALEDLAATVVESAAVDVVASAPEPDVPAMPPVAPPPVAPSADVRKMDQSALVFLENPLARRLAVAWVTCGGNELTWFEAAGLPSHDAEAKRVARSLRMNAVCRDGGVTDSLAVQYIQAVIARPLAAARQKSKKGSNA